jgi:hypothetical protein
MEIGQYIRLEPPPVPGFPHVLSKTDAVYLAQKHQADLDLAWEVYITLPSKETMVLDFGDLMVKVIGLLPEEATYHTSSVSDMGVIQIHFDSAMMTEDHINLLASHAN